MTRVITARNVNDAFVEGWWWLKVAGIKEDSRNGPVLVAPGPVITEYARPRERVLFNPKRDANPVFHLMECIWMMAGENDTYWLEQFNPRMAEYTEDHIMHGAYGHRWRRHFHLEQLGEIVEILRDKPDSRQAVLAMWDAPSDLVGRWKDRPCNTHIYFDLRGGALNMTVCCRSNDMVWGAYGANAVHFSFLQEVLASELKVETGVYRQMSNNFHVYTDLEMVQNFLGAPPRDEYNFYLTGEAAHIPLIGSGESMHDLTRDCEAVVTGSAPESTVFMRQVAYPLYRAYQQRKAKEGWSLDTIPNCDWKLAFKQWVDRRNAK